MEIQKSREKPTSILMHFGSSKRSETFSTTSYWFCYIFEHFEHKSAWELFDQKCLQSVAFFCPHYFSTGCNCMQSVSMKMSNIVIEMFECLSNFLVVFDVFDTIYGRTPPFTFFIASLAKSMLEVMVPSEVARRPEPYGSLSLAD